MRRGERLYISPYRGQADRTVDTYLPYETNILMQYLSEKLQGEERMLEQADLAPLSAIPVSYTHLDVYKRQGMLNILLKPYEGKADISGSVVLATLQSMAG